MGTRIEYLTNKGAFEEAHGSDTRLNVSSRSDQRSFYVSRDDGQYYSLQIEDDAADAGDIVGYLRNDSNSLALFIRDIHFSAEFACTVKLAFGDSTAATGGSVLTPANLNRTKSSNAADVTARGNGAISGVSATTQFAAFRIEAGSTFEYNQTIILGQNDNITIEYDTGSTGDLEVDVYFYLDTLS